MFNSVSFVDLLIDDAATGGSGNPANVQVNIRAGSITGTILGSSTATVPPGTNTGGGTKLTDFSFATPIALTPGSTYVIETFQTAPIIITPPSQSNINYLWCGGPIGSSTYPNGDAYISGKLQTGFDFAFQEGINSVPEPTSLVLVALGVGGVLLSAGLRRRLASPGFSRRSRAS